MAETTIAAAQQLLNTSPVAAVIADQDFNPLWYNDSYKLKFEPFDNIDRLLKVLLILESDDVNLFMFKKIFLPIKVKYNATGEMLYLTKFPIFKGEKFILSLTTLDQWIDNYSYSDEFFREAFLMTPNPIVLFSFVTGKIKYLNSAFSKICSMPPEHITNMSLTNLFPEGKDTIEEYLARPEPYAKPFILRAVQIDGKMIILEISPFVFNENGTVMVVFNVQDITKHMTSQLDVISDESDQYRLFSKAINDAVIVTAEKKIIKVNDRACKLWGYAESELVGTHVSVLFRDGKIAYKATDNVEPLPFEGIRKDGAVFKGEKISRYFLIGGGHLMVNVMRPVEDAQFVEAMPLSSKSAGKERDFERKILDYQPNIIIVYDKSYNVVSCNKVALDYFKCAILEGFKEKYSDLYKHFVEKEGTFLTPKSGKGWFTIPLANPNKEYKAALKDETDEGAEERIFFVKSGKINDEEASYVVSLSDITDTMQTTMAFKDVNDILADKTDIAVSELRASEELLIQQQKLASMGEMLNVITHQWKQPLNAIGILTQNIGLVSEECFDCSVKQEITELTSSIVEHISFMAETADNFNNFFKNNEAKTSFLISDAIISTIKILNSIFKTNNITIEYTVSDDCKSLVGSGNCNDFRQIIMNAITNGKDAIIDKRNSQNKKHEGKIEVNLSYLGNNMLEVRISDNGVGIPEKSIPKVFERYFTTKGGSGTGIGMYISKIIAEKMGGSIECGNHEDGAFIRLQLPVVDSKNV